MSRACLIDPYSKTIGPVNLDFYCKDAISDLLAVNGVKYSPTFCSLDSYENCRGLSFITNSRIQPNGEDIFFKVKEFVRYNSRDESADDSGWFTGTSLGALLIIRFASASNDSVDKPLLDTEPSDIKFVCTKYDIRDWENKNILKQYKFNY